MQPNFIILETLANGTRRTHALSQLPTIAAQDNARYAVVDTNTGKAPAGLTLQREGNTLKVLVNAETVVQITDFYNADVLAQFSTEGSVSANDDVLICASSDETASLSGAASGDEFDGMTIGQAIYSLGAFLVIGGAAVAEKHKDDDDNDIIVSGLSAPIPSMATDSGSSDSDLVTTDGTVNVTGIKEGATWEYSTNGGDTWTAGVGTSFELANNTTYAVEDVQLRQTSSSGKTSSTAANSMPITIDSLAPVVTFTSASYNASNNTITIEGLNLNSLLTTGESDTTNIVANLDWSKLQWDFGSDDTGNATFTQANIGIAKVTSDTSLNIVLSTAKAAAIEGTSGFDALNVDDQIEISDGFSRDTAGNTATEDAFTSFPGDESIVVFDLVAGHSSWHSARIFNADTAYTIYIIVNSTTEDVMLNPADVWSGGENLGNDDFIWLVGTGDPLLGAQSGTINVSNVSHAGSGYIWQTNIHDDAAGIVQHSGIFTRVAPSSLSDSTRIFNITSTVAFPLYGAGRANTMPAGIMTSQGLVYV